MIINALNLGSYYVIASISKIFKVSNTDIDANIITLSDNTAQAVSLIEYNDSVVSITTQPDPLVTIVKS